MDAAAKVDASKPFVPFTYAPASPDTANPNGTVTSPTNDQVLSASPITFSGNATDDRSVASVRVGDPQRHDVAVVERHRVPGRRPRP